MLREQFPDLSYPISETDLLKLVQELKIHQLELELQNEELLLEKERTATASERFVELYDFAPSGYLTLSSSGKILELNLAAAKMLLMGRSELKNRLFKFFLSESTRSIFNGFLENVFKSTTRLSCELVLSAETHQPINVRIDGIISVKAEECLITMVDITEQKQNEAIIKKSEIFLKSAQLIAGLGTFSIDLVRGTWESSEVLDLIFGISPDYEKSFSSWVSIVHPDWQQKMRDYFHSAVSDHDPVFETEYQIIRQSDHSERWIHVTGQIEFNSQNLPLVLLGALGDITSRKLIEEKLKASEKSYHNLFVNLHVGVLIQGPNSEILMSNNRALELLGLTEDQLLGKTSFDKDWNVIHEDGTPYPGPTHPVPQSIATCQSVRNAVMGVYRPAMQDRVWLLVNADPELNKDGNVKEVICTFEDITELKKTEVALSKSEYFYRTLFENMNCFSYCQMLFEDGKPSDFIYLMVNAAFETQTGLKNVIGKKITDLIPGILETDREWLVIYGRVAKTGVSERFEMFMEALKMWYSVLVYSPKPDHFVAVFDVITERKMLEQKVISNERQYRDIFHKNTAVKFIIDPASGSILTTNQAAANFYGYSVSQLETMNINEINILPPDQVQAEMSLAFNERRHYFNFRHRLASGEVRDVEVYSGPIETGERTLLYSIVHDISKRKQAELELANSQSFLNSIIEHSPNSLWISDEKGTLIRMNKACRDTLFVSEEEVVGIYNILEDNVIEEQGFMLHVRSVFENGKTVRFNINYDTSKVRNLQLKQTKQLDLDVNISPILDSSGNVINAIIQHTDITDLKKTEAALILSESRFRATLENSYDAIGVHVNGIWKMCNPAAVKLFGVASPDELLGTSLLDVISPKERSRIGDFVHRRTEESDAPTNYVTIGLRQDGTEFDMDVRLSTFVLDNKRHVLAVLHDITEMLKIRQALLESEARYRTVVEFSSNSIVVHQDEKFVFVNTAAVKLFGASSANDLIGYSIYKLMDPDFRPLIKERIRKGYELGEVGPRIVGKYFKLDGTPFIAEVQGGPIMFDGKLAIQASMYDITERNEAELKLKQLSDRLLLATRVGRVGIWDYDIVNDRIVLDDQMFIFYGIDKKNFDSTAAACLACIHPDDLSKLNSEIYLAYQGTRDLDTEFRVIWPDGTVHYLKSIAIVYRDDSGNPYRMLGTNWDITQRKLYERERIDKNIELERANNEKDKFFSIIAHDLRSPFNGFLGLTQMLDEDLPEMSTKEIQESARLMRKSATNLFDLLGNLLEWSRSRRGLKVFVPELCSFNSKINDCIALVQEAANHKNIAINCNIQDHLIVFADENMLSTILRNILSNAVKFTPRGGNITVYAGKISDNSVECTITDSGIGMSKQIIDNVFRLDVNTNRIGTEAELSTGLGLILCKDFIEKHGGELSVESEEGNGSTFRFTLPDQKV